MKKILFIINKLGGGGAERVLTLIANQLSNINQYEIDILSICRFQEKYEINSTINVIELDSLSGNAFEIIKSIRKEVLLIKPDVLVSFEYHMNMKTIIATRGIKNIRLIISERNDPHRRGGKIGMRQLRNFLYNNSACLVCQTVEAKAYFPNKIQKKTVIIPNPINENLPAPYLGRKAKKIVNFCRLEPQKNLKLLINAFKSFSEEYSEYTLIIYGDGILKEELEHYIVDQKLQEKATLHSSIPNIYEEVKDAAMFVSSSDFEGISNSMLEAMALGIPTICTDCPCGGARMVINDGINGILIPVGNKAAMVEAMKRLARDDNFSKEIAEKAKEIKKTLASHIIIDKWMHTINDNLVKGKSI